MLRNECIPAFLFIFILATTSADATDVESSCLGNHTLTNEFDELSLLTISSKVIHRGGQLGKWKTLTQAGWTKEQIKSVKDEERAEFSDPAFQQKLLNQVTLIGISDVPPPFNNQFRVFARPENAEAYWETRRASGHECTQQKQVVFVLGPSGAGKTASAATLFHSLNTEGGYGDGTPPPEFPAMMYDGADLRDVSDIWKRDAQSGNLLSDFYDKVWSPVVEKVHKNVIKDFMAAHQPCTLLRPDTAVKDFMEAKGTVTPMALGLAKQGYMVKFVAVIAPFEKVAEKGKARAETEGKKFSSDNYIMALNAVEKLSGTFGVEHFTFVENTMEENEPLNPLTPEQWSAKVRQQKVFAKEDLPLYKKMWPWCCPGPCSRCAS